MDELQRMSRRRKAAHKRLVDLDSKVYKAFLDMEAAAFSGVREIICVSPLADAVLKPVVSPCTANHLTRVSGS